MRAQSSALSTLRVVVPLVSLGLLFALWRLGLSWWQSTPPVVALLALYYLVIPRVVARHLDRFNRAALEAIMRGKGAEVPAMARRELLLQLFAPGGALDAKLALAYAETGEHGRAIGHFQRALEIAPPTERPALETGLVKCYFVTGDLAKADSRGTTLLDRMTRLPELLVIVARSRMGRGKQDDRTRALLDEAERLSPNDDVSLMLTLSRIELSLATGRKAPALPEGADSKLAFVRAWIHLVRGLLRAKRGDDEKALRSFEKADAAAPTTFAAAAARERLATASVTATEEGQPPGELDPQMRRKRRKRR